MGNPSFFHLAHFAKYVTPGSKRVDLKIKCGARHAEYCQAVSFITPEGNAVVVLTNDEITVGSVAGGLVSRLVMSPRLAKGQGTAVLWQKTLTWRISCGGRAVSGEIPWKAIQSIVFQCSGTR